MYGRSRSILLASPKESLCARRMMPPIGGTPVGRSPGGCRDAPLADDDARMGGGRTVKLLRRGIEEAIAISNNKFIE